MWNLGRQQRCVQAFCGRPEGWGPFKRPRKWEDIIKMSLQELGWGGIEWVDLPQGG
jgi:hypothetical protein